MAPALRPQVVAQKTLAIPRDKCDARIGRLDEATLIALNHMLSVVVGIAD